jgi:carboxypeptidase Taq
LEQALFEGSVTVEDLPSLWNKRMKELLGVEVPSDSMGVLQDIHWSGGTCFEN